MPVQVAMIANITFGRSVWFILGSFGWLSLATLVLSNMDMNKWLSSQRGSLVFVKWYHRQTTKIVLRHEYI